MDEYRQLDRSRDGAASECSSSSDGASLATIDTEDELEFLTREIKGRVTASGQEFAHEQWWTAGRARTGRWVWDVLGYPQGITLCGIIPSREFLAGKCVVAAVLFWNTPHVLHG